MVLLINIELIHSFEWPKFTEVGGVWWTLLETLNLSRRILLIAIVDLGPAKETFLNFW